MTELVDSAADIFRVINGVLALVCAAMVMFDRGAPWRNPLSTLRLFSFSIAALFLWQTYTSIEVIVTTHGGADGVRVYGFTGAYSLVLWALFVERQRGRKIRRTHTLAEPLVVVTRSETADIMKGIR